MGKKLPRGFVIEKSIASKHEVVFRLRRHYESGAVRTIGWCRLEHGYHHWFSHSEIVYRKYLNRGYGLILYTRAIEWALRHGYSVSSSAGHSKMAERLWQSRRLRRLFKVKQVDSQFLVKKQRGKTIILHKKGIKIVSRKKFDHKTLTKMDKTGIQVKR